MGMEMHIAEQIRNISLFKGGRAVPEAVSTGVSTLHSAAKAGGLERTDAYANHCWKKTERGRERMQKAPKRMQKQSVADES
jgi:hypothetical protein